jgi:hypothetical protein
VTHLTTKDTQLAYARESSSLPVRRDAVGEFLADLEPCRETIEHVMANGRSHAAVRLWSRIEHQFGLALDGIASEVLNGPHDEIAEIISLHLEPLATRMDLTLGR